MLLLGKRYEGFAEMDCCYFGCEYGGFAEMDCCYFGEEVGRPPPWAPRAPWAPLGTLGPPGPWAPEAAGRRPTLGPRALGPGGRRQAADPGP